MTEEQSGYNLESEAGVANDMDQKANDFGPTDAYVRSCDRELRTTALHHACQTRVVHGYGMGTATKIASAAEVVADAKAFYAFLKGDG